MIGNCENCGSEFIEGDIYIAARRFGTGMNDAFALIHTDCPKDFRARAEATLLAGGSATALALMALIEKLDELPILALTAIQVGGDDDDQR